jgi:hypothetical protein
MFKAYDDRYKNRIILDILMQILYNFTKSRASEYVQSNFKPYIYRTLRNLTISELALIKYRFNFQWVKMACI